MAKAKRKQPRSRPAAARKRSASGARRSKRTTKRSPRPPSATAKPEGRLPERSGFALSDAELERALVTGEHAGLIEDYLGPEQYRELSALAREASTRAVRGGPRVLILPGIMGSKLGLPRSGWFDDVIWLDPLDVARGNLKQLAFKGGPGSVRPLGVLLFTYLRMKLQLCIEGFDADFHPYDWRCGLDVLGRELARRLREERHPVSLVAHSMGGLVSRAALAEAGLGEKVVDRLVMLGTPNQGSFVPVQALRGSYGIVRKIAALDLTGDAEELARSVFSSFPGLYQMLPSPQAVAAFDLYDAANWPSTGPAPRPALLAAAKRARERLAKPDARFRLIAGVNQETVIGLTRRDGELVYEYGPAGDGTVPLAFAELSGVPTYYVDESHGSLPNNGRVVEAVGDLLRSGETAELPRTWSAPRRGIARRAAESELAAEPYGGRRGGELSQRELRQLVEELAAPEPSRELVQVSAPFRGVVVGRRRQHRVDLCLSRDSITAADARAYVLGIFRDVAPSGAADAIDRHLGGAVREFAARRMFSGNAGEVFDMPAGRQALYADHVLFVGLGSFDELDDERLELAAESAMRMLVRTKIEECATVLFGTGSGWTAARSANDLLRGFLRALLDADDDHRFRSITFCETDDARYAELRDEIYRLAGTELFDEVEVTISELPSRVPPAAPAAPLARAPERGPQPVYLIVREESGKNAGELVLRTSLLGADGRAAVQSEPHALKRAELDKHLKSLAPDTFKAAALKAFGTKLGELVLDPRIREGLARSFAHPWLVVHDATAARVPWETLCLAGRFPAAEGGLSRRYMAENLSIAKWLEERRKENKLRLLLVVNPTLDLAGAEEEGDLVRKLFEARRAVQIDELRGDAATKKELEKRFRSREYDAVHYAGHAFFDPDDPPKSGLLCAHEEVLSGADLSRLSSLPALVFFNACESARLRRGVVAKQSDRTPQNRLARTAGLAESFLRGGVASYIGTYWPVGDAAAKTFAETFYGALLDGAPIGPALKTAREAVREQGSVDWADYVHYGSPEFKVKEL